MREFQPTGKRFEELRRAEEEIKGTLQEFLDSNYRIIRKLRVYRQIMDMQGNMSSQTTEELESSINEEKGNSFEMTVQEYEYSIPIKHRFSQR